jgi:DNA sulfur modification protein DndC
MQQEEAQQSVRQNGPPTLNNIELITLPELEEIRRLWVIEKHEVEDKLPRTYEEVTGQPYPGRRVDDTMVFGPEEMNILADISEGDRLHYQLVRELLDVEHRYRTMARRAGLYEALDQAFRRSFYQNEDDATHRARRRSTAIAAAKDGDQEQLSLVLDSTAQHSNERSDGEQ